MDESKDTMLDSLDPSEVEVKPKKRGKKRNDDDDFGPGFMDADDDFEIKDAASDYDSLPSDISEEDIPDALADLPDTPPKRIRKPKGEKKPSIKRSAPKSPSKAKKAYAPAPEPPSMGDDIIYISDSEDFNPNTNHSSDNDDIVVGKSIKQYKSYYKPKSTGKHTTASEKPKTPQNSASKASSAAKTKENALSSSLPSFSESSPNMVSEMAIDALPLESATLIADQSSTADLIVSTSAKLSDASDVAPRIENEKKRSREEDDVDEAESEAKRDETSTSFSEATEVLPPSPKKPKLEESASASEVVVMASSEPLEAKETSSSKPGPKAKKSAKSASASKKTATKGKPKSSAAKKAESETKIEKSETSAAVGATASDSSSVPLQSTEVSSGNKMDVDKSDVPAKPILGATEKSDAQKMDSAASKSSQKSTVAEAEPINTVASAVKPAAISKTTPAKPTSSVKSSAPKSTTSTLSTVSPQKRASTSTLNAPFKLVGASSQTKPGTSLPTQNRPIMRMGLSRASKPLHPTHPIK